MKSNKLSTVLLLVLIFLLVKNLVPAPGGVVSLMQRSSYDTGVSEMKLGVPSSEVAPVPEVKNRMTIQESYLSLQVKNVASSLSQIKKYAETNNGYMIDSNLSRPQDAPFGQISVRVPQKDLEKALEFFRSLAVKVVSENLSGYDVTDQFVDNEARMKILENNKSRFEDIMAKAVSVEDILRVQQEIFNLQSQIDSIKGQQDYLSKTSQMVRINISLSTDELALPYAPSNVWRPGVIFKRAVRSLIGSLQGLGSGVIWLVVYSVVWLPVVLIFFFLMKRNSRR